MHKGKKCDGKLYGAQSAFIPIANKADLGMGFVPDYTAVQIGDKITLSLHAVLGFTDIILRLVSSIDAELAKAQPSEAIIAARIAASKSAPIAATSLRSLFNTMGMQGVQITPDLIAMLRSLNAIA